jgi:kinesin family protein 15
MQGESVETDIKDVNRGLIPRVFEYIFTRIEEDQSQENTEFLTSCSYLEIYNENIIDLLNPSSGKL